MVEVIFMGVMETNKEKAVAREEIIKSIRNLLSLKITLPLGNPNLKLVHTNQFLWTELPTDVFELANMEALATAMNSTYSRYSGYEVNRWYIEGITITNDGKKATMDMELNPFASTVMKFRDNYHNYEQAYSDAMKQNSNNNSNTNVSNNVSNKINNSSNKSQVSSTKIKFTKVKGQSKSDQKFLEEIVTKALKNAGNPKSDFKRAKAMHEYYKKNHLYTRYCNMKWKSFKKAWNTKRHNCGDGARCVSLMLKCLGFNPTVYLRSSPNGHYWVKVRIDGKNYYCDQSGSPHNTRVLGASGGDSNVWKGTGGGIDKGWDCYIPYRAC